MNREELKRLWFSLPWDKTKPEIKEVVVEVGENPHWLGYGTVTITSDGPDGFSQFSTHQENPIQYAKDRMKEERYKKYKLIVK